MVQCIKYGSTIYRDHEGMDGDFGPKLSPQYQLDICFLTVWECWLGIAKPKNVFRSTPNCCIELLWNFKNFLFNTFFCWPNDWLTDLLLLTNAKHNSIMAIATGFIASLINVASSGDMHLCQPSSSNVCIIVLPKLIPLCSIPFFLTT